MEFLNLPLKGESLTIFQSELKHQRKLVRSLKKSLWSRNLEEIVEKLVDIVTYINQTLSEFLGDYGTLLAIAKYSKGSQRLGEAGLALHYANIINKINIIVRFGREKRGVLFNYSIMLIQLVEIYQVGFCLNKKLLSIRQIRSCFLLCRLDGEQL